MHPSTPAVCNFAAILTGFFGGGGAVFFLGVCFASVGCEWTLPLVYPFTPGGGISGFMWTLEDVHPGLVGWQRVGVGGVRCVWTLSLSLLNDTKRESS